MLNEYYKEYQRIYKEIQELIENLQERIADEEVVDEEDITSRLLENLARVLTRKEAGFTLNSRAITLKKQTEEPKVGADILILTSFASPKITVTKGFLA